MGNIIEIENLYYTYPKGRRALTEINLEVKEGEFLVIMGPNGAGKTTFCLTLNGIVPSTTGGRFSGEIRVKGMDTVEHRVYELASHIGIVQQNPESQLFMSNLEQELAFGPENLCIPKEEIQKRITRALKQVRLEGMEHRSPAELSGGQKQRAAIATVLTMQPDILVLDEPTSQLDPIGTEDVFSIVKDLNKRSGKTIVMAEHKSEEIAEFADRIIILDQGKIVLQGKPKEVFSQVDFLHSINVKPPQVTELSHHLTSQGLEIDDLPITLADATELYRTLLQNNKLSVNPHWTKTHRDFGSEPDTILEVNGLVHIFPQDINALKGISVKINKGDFVALIGQNGAGKTTLVKHFLNLIQPTDGKVYYSGYDCSQITIADLARHIGLVLQNPDHQLFESSVYKEVRYGLNNLIAANKQELDNRINKALETIGIQAFKDKHPLSLSWGDRQKVAVAAVLAMEPNIIIFDEPTTGMDYRGRHNIMQLAKDLNERGHTILAISHDIELLAEYSNSTIVMGQGEILYQGPTYEALSQEEVLKETFLKPPQITLLSHNLTDLGVPSGIVTINDFCAAFGLPLLEAHSRKSNLQHLEMN